MNKTIPNIKSLQIDDYTYELPEERIAKYPLKNRDHSKLLIYNNGNIDENAFKSLPSFINTGSLMVFNNTKVIQARLNFRKQTGASIEIFCLEPLNPSDYALAFQAKKSSSWKCIVGNLRKWKSGSLNMDFVCNGNKYSLTAERVKSMDDAQEIFFSWNNKELSFSEVLEFTGNIPIPPYLNRKSDDNDLVRYQTVYSKNEGSVAAPTAGLHFTKETFNEFAVKNINWEELTLHVGAGTFKPVKAKYIAEHDMHTEHISINIKSLKNICEKVGQIIAVGTTSVRTLESLYWIGVKIIENKINPNLLLQWEAYELTDIHTVKDALNALIDYMQKKEITTFYAATQIIITPGYRFKVITGLITNFHQPKSTLLLLIAAIVGDDWRKIYQHAIKNNFRFLSYGDSSLLFRNR